MRRLAAVGFALLVAFSSAGCEDAEEAFFTGMLLQWWLDKIERDPVGGLGNQLGVEDPETTAALDAEKVIEDIERADRLADEGRRNRDPAKLDEALRLRPNDWSYKNSRAVLALEQGDLEGYDQYAGELFPLGELTEFEYHNGIRQANQRFDELRELERKLTAQRGPGFSSAEQCEKLYKELEYLVSWSQENRATRSAQRDAFLARKADCV